jgi:general stress protein 26
MSDKSATPSELREKFWRALEHSPYLMLQLDSDPQSLSPMTAQLDRDGNHHIWFYTSRLGAYAVLGDATAVFVSKSHDVFARFDGVLSEETDPEVFERHWSRQVQAWFPGGKTDPNLMMLRMALGEASIWSTEELGLLGHTRMMLGMDVRGEARSGHTTTRI